MEIERNVIVITYRVRLTGRLALIAEETATVKLLTKDEARRIAANIAKLPELLWKP